MPRVRSFHRVFPINSTQNHLTANPHSFHHKYSRNLISLFVEQNYQYALSFALTQNVYDDPWYFNLLCSHLLETHAVHPTDVVRLLKTQAFCVGLLQNTRAITVCVRKFIDAAPTEALQEAFECYQPERNPAYYARICDLLSQDIFSASMGAEAHHLYMLSNNITKLMTSKLTDEQCKIYAELHYKKSYCLALMKVSKGMVNNLKEAVLIHKEHVQKLLTESYYKYSRSNIFDIELIKMGLQIPSQNQNINFTHYRHDPYSPNIKKMLNLQEQDLREQIGAIYLI